MGLILSQDAHVIAAESALDIFAVHSTLFHFDDDLNAVLCRMPSCPQGGEHTNLTASHLQRLPALVTENLRYDRLQVEVGEHHANDRRYIQSGVCSYRVVAG